MVLNEKPTKNCKLRGLKLRGLSQNPISTPYFIYENDQNNLNIHVSITCTQAYGISNIFQEEV